jgi:2-iminoacetate synthase ThiH
VTSAGRWSTLDTATSKLLVVYLNSSRHAGNDDAEVGWRAIINAGANDFGGISPVTKDYVNPEKSWPHLHSLAAATAAAGKALVPR